MKLPNWLDNFLWNNSRRYRARLSRKRLLTEFPECKFCGTRFAVKKLRNGGHLCEACQHDLKSVLEAAK